jgi:hypothetical protein
MGPGVRPNPLNKPVRAPQGAPVSRGHLRLSPKIDGHMADEPGCGRSRVEAASVAVVPRSGAVLRIDGCTDGGTAPWPPSP